MGYLMLTPRHRLSICVSFKVASTQVRAFFEALNGEGCPIGAGDLHSKHLLEQNKCFGCSGYSEWPYGRVPASRKSLSCEDRAYSYTSRDPSFLHVLLLRDPLERLISAYLDRCAGRTGLKCRPGLCMCKHEDRPTMGGFVRLLETLSLARNASGGRLTSIYDHHFREQMADCASFFRQHPHDQSFRVVRWEGYRSINGSSSRGTSLHSQMKDICRDRGLNESGQHSCEAFFPRVSTSTHRTGGRMSQLWRASNVSKAHLANESIILNANSHVLKDSRPFDSSAAMRNSSIGKMVRDLYWADYAAFERFDLCAGPISHQRESECKQ